MISMGDEYGHTKDGNNNTYCHDSPWNYLDWQRAWDDEDGLRRFWTCMIRLRRMRPEFAQAHYLTREARTCGFALFVYSRHVTLSIHHSSTKPAQVHMKRSVQGQQDGRIVANICLCGCPACCSVAVGDMAGREGRVSTRLGQWPLHCSHTSQRP
jgi:pullulanase/glycogen debranching enzyme